MDLWGFLIVQLKMYVKEYVFIILEIYFKIYFVCKSIGSIHQSIYRGVMFSNWTDLNDMACQAAFKMAGIQIYGTNSYE